MRPFCSALAALAVCLAAQPAALGGDVEPNDRLEQAVPARVGETASGVVHRNDQRDHFAYTLPDSGIVSVRLHGYAADVAFQVIVTGFQHYEASTAGWVDGLPGKTVEFSFAAQGGRKGFLTVRLKSRHAGLSVGMWGAVRCSETGPWYYTPDPNKPEVRPPAMHKDVPVKGPIRYTLDTSFQSMADAFEPNFVPGKRPADLLKAGKLKSIPLGQWSQARLFNDHPALLRGTPGKKDARGGEEDIDVYHVRWAKAGTLQVAVRHLPASTNHKITVFYPGGWSASKTGASSFEVKVARPGDIFVQVSRGDERRPLVFTPAPYFLAVTTPEIGLPSLPDDPAGKQPTEADPGKGTGDDRMVEVPFGPNGPFHAKARLFWQHVYGNDEQGALKLASSDFAGQMGKLGWAAFRTAASSNGTGIYKAVALIPADEQRLSAVGRLEFANGRAATVCVLFKDGLIDAIHSRYAR